MAIERNGEKYKIKQLEKAHWFFPMRGISADGVILEDISKRKQLHSKIKFLVELVL